ncbi:MAG TPA: phage protein [Gammaproteobacteria bacterium]|nr:phage protein [Gammaproteobacteria bacterium]
MSVYTYAAESVRIIVGGVPISGLADGTFVSISRDEQAYNKTTGADGTTSRSRTGNRAGTIAITLQQTSPSNDTLSGFMLADEASDQGVVPVLIKDTSGRTLHYANSAWVQQKPDEEFGKEISDREWTLDCARIDSFVGGNTSQTGGSE